MGEQGLDYGITKQHFKRIKELEKENTKLKEVVADKELEVRMHEEIKKRLKSIFLFGFSYQYLHSQ